MAEKLNTAVLIPLIWIICNFKSTASQNAQLSVIPETVPVGGAITLTCHYIGTQDETAVFWFNGSNSSPLTLTPASASDGPDCNVFAVVNATYDLSRLRYTCDRKSNTYTLKIDPVQTVDDNVTWSCSFPDPVPDSNRAKHTIHVHLGETSGDSGAGVIEVSTVH